MYREPGEDSKQDISIGLRNRDREQHGNSRLSQHGKGGRHQDPITPGYAPNKASDLIAHMNSKVSLPRIQSSRSNQMVQKTPSLVSRQQSRAKMLEIQNRGGLINNVSRDNND